MVAERMPNKGLKCAVEGCERGARCKGYCMKHDAYRRSGGDPHNYPTGVTAEERFWAGIDKRGDDECWEWTKRNLNGYGRFRVDGKETVVHRYAYELLVGPIPEGLHIDHLCRNHPCCNPAHLEPVTQRENTLRGIAPPAINAKKTHCKYGHPFDEENTRITPTGGRTCRTCHRNYVNEANRRKRAA